MKIFYRDYLNLRLQGKGTHYTVAEKEKNTHLKGQYENLFGVPYGL